MGTGDLRIKELDGDRVREKELLGTKAREYLEASIFKARLLNTNSPCTFSFDELYHKQAGRRMPKFRRAMLHSHNRDIGLPPMACGQRVDIHVCSRTFG